MGWQPIETAPRDGTKVLLWPSGWNNCEADVGWWNAQKYNNKPSPFWEYSLFSGRPTICREHPPTHWMPLPEGPGSA